MIKMNSRIIHLNEDLVARVQLASPTLFYPVETEVIYEGHTPIVAILLLRGQIHLFRGRRLKEILERGAILGVPELMDHLPFQYTARIMRGSEICYLDRSTLLEILQGGDGELVQAIEELLNE